MTFSVFGVVFFNWASLSVGDDSGEDEDENDDDDAQALQPCLGWLGCAVPSGVWAGAPGALPLCGGPLGLPVCGLVGSALFRLFGLCSCVFGSERVLAKWLHGPQGRKHDSFEHKAATILMGSMVRMMVMRRTMGRLIPMIMMMKLTTIRMMIAQLLMMTMMMMGLTQIS